VRGKEFLYCTLHPSLRDTLSPQERDSPENIITILSHVCHWRIFSIAYHLRDNDDALYSGSNLGRFSRTPYSSSGMTLQRGLRTLADPF
jgi:hypothetical protein